MQAALIVMTILGCDDAAIDCHYVATEEKRWPTIALCEADSERQLGLHANTSHYPVLIATCRMPETEVAATAPQQSQPQVETAEAAIAAKSEETGLARRAIAHARALLPSASGAKELAAKPVHFVADGYSWAVSVFRK